MSKEQFIRDASAAAKLAIASDQAGDQQAPSLYMTAASRLRKVAEVETNPTASASYRSKANEYAIRAAELNMGIPRIDVGPPAPSAPPIGSSLAPSVGSMSAPAIGSMSFGQMPESLPRARTPSPLSTRKPSKKSNEAVGDRLYRQAQEHHQEGSFRRAEDLYRQATEKYILAHQEQTTPTKKGTLKIKTEQALEAAESLHIALGNKNAIGRAKKAPSPASPTKRKAVSTQPTISDSIIPSDGGYSENEKRILAYTSKVNNEVYVPWVDEADLREDFVAEGLFHDPSGKLKLAAKQKEYFIGWKRPAELFPERARMCKSISSASIRQTVVGDCSFVCALAISADYERKFKRPLITNRLFPRRNGQPCVNPLGKYMIKLYFNGSWRKIIIDDFLPVGRGNGLLCSHSNHSGELWVSLIEKAYLKVMGGYDFPGSNSGVDLHALTGWIPERINCKSLNESTWKRIGAALHTGDVLLTVATGQMSSHVQERTGLSDCHAYAVLNMREINGVRLLKIKNPWNHGRWKGKYSPDDNLHWTAELASKLDYDVGTARRVDDGEFWMDLDSVKSFFDVFHLNWNPSIFKFRYSLHKSWLQKSGPVRDLYNMGENPQFRLEFKTKEPAILWILLSRHITTIDDFANNREFITCHLYDGGDTVYYPDNPLVQGTKINSPHYLARFNHPGDKKKYSIVISQHEKSTNLYFTLKVYASADFKIFEMPNPYHGRKEKSFEGEWTSRTAGGSTNNPEMHDLNPKWAIKIGSGTELANTKAKLRIQLSAPKQFPIGITLRGPNNQSIHTKSYRPGFVILESDQVVAGATYTMIPSTFDVGMVGPYIFKVIANTRFEVTKA